MSSLRATLYSKEFWILELRGCKGVSLSLAPGQVFGLVAERTVAGGPPCIPPEVQQTYSGGVEVLKAPIGSDEYVQRVLADHAMSLLLS